ncbi:MAG: TonB-dependent receptor [Reichenbachiella sp.]
MKQSAVIILFSLISIFAQAQMDSVWLQDVSITSERLQTYAVGDKITPIDSSQISIFSGNSIAHLLATSAPINIRAYGVSGLSTASMRGTGSNHTAVVWEGLNLQSQMNGSLDLNLVPAILFDNVSIQSGGSSTMFGSGAMGGTIQLGSNTSKYNKGLSVGVNELMGSYGKQNHSLKTSYSNDRWYLNIKAFHQQADNEFEFYNDFFEVEEVLKNAGSTQYGGLADIGFQINSNHEVTAKYWFQNNNTQIPKTASAGLPSQAEQDDIIHRALIKYDGTLSDQIALNYKIGYLDHNLYYDDHGNIQSNNHSSSLINELLVNLYTINWLQIETGANYTFETGDADNFDGQADRNNISLFVASNISINPKLDLNIAGRQNVIDNNFSPFLPSIGIHYQVLSILAIKSKVARSYRAPTFNDLYWYAPGSAIGNPDLVAEDGMSYDLGYVIEAKESNYSLFYEGTVFYNHINNWINWNSISNVWQPVNEDQLWSYGIEQSIRTSWKVSTKSKISLNLNYQYTVSKLDSISNDNQTSYTPLHQGNLFLRYHYLNWNIGLIENLMGKQYSDNGNIELNTVEKYTLTDLNLGYHFKRNKNQFSINIKVNNLLDTTYEVRRGYPMPGRNYQLNLVYQFN